MKLRKIVFLFGLQCVLEAQRAVHFMALSAKLAHAIPTTSDGIPRASSLVKERLHLVQPLLEGIDSLVGKVVASEAISVP